MANCDAETCECLVSQVAVLETNQGKLYANDEALNADIAAEEAAREAADDALQTEIDGLNAVDTDFNARITNNETAIAALQAESDYPWDDIRRYGAVEGAQTWPGAGEEPSDVAILAAVNALGSAFVPPGTWYFEDQLVLPDGAWVHGAGWESSEIRWTDNNAGVAALNNTDALMMVRGQQGVSAYPAYETRRNIVIEGVHFNGNGDNQTNANGALDAIHLYGEDHTIRNCKFSGFRAGINKEAFVVLISGTYVNPTFNPARNCHVIDCLFCDNAEQPDNSTTLEFSQVGIFGYFGAAGGEDPENLANDCSVKGCLFRDLVQNGTTQRRLIQAVSVFGSNILVSGNTVRGNTGDVRFLNLQSGSIDSLRLFDNFYDGASYAINAYIDDTESITKMFVRRNEFISSLSGVVKIVKWTTGTGVLQSITFEQNHIVSTGGTPIAIESRLIANQGLIKVTDNELEGTGAFGVAVLFTAGESPGPNQPNPGDWIVGDNYTPSGARSTITASGGGAITWAVNPDFTDVT